jgi:aspartyl-tRNA(Asn)/glutamyl-tRNA(Gln) amidotransferase subunit A
MARDVDGCERMLAALAPGFEPATLDALSDVRVGVASLDRAEPLVRERVLAAAARFPDRRDVEVPSHADTYPAFTREAGAVHAPLFAEHRALYGEDVAAKVERALRIGDDEAAAGAQERERYRERIAALFDAVDLVLTPTLMMVAPPTGVGDRALREDVIELTFPWNVVGAPALALPCGPAELGLPASVQLVGRPGDDALVLAAGRLLEAALAAQAPST